MNKELLTNHFIYYYLIPDNLLFSDPMDKILYKLDEIQFGLSTDFFSYFSIAPYTEVSSELSKILITYKKSINNNYKVVSLNLIFRHLTKLSDYYKIEIEK
jgi:hypothetical protein